MFNAPQDAEPDFFAYTDRALTGSISQSVRQNDKITLQRILNKRKRKPYPLSSDNRKWTAVHLAASEPQKKECLEILIRHRKSILLNLDDETFEGQTALHIACEYGCDENVSILLREGCDPQKKTLEGDSALHIAANKGYLKIVQCLLNYNINIDDKDWQNFTPLHLSAMFGHFEISRILLEKGTSVRSVDSNGNFPFHLACQNGYFDIVRLLLEHDSTLINHQNLDGITPIMLAAMNNNVSVVRYLLMNKAEVHLWSEFNKTALHYAAASGNVEILQLVLQATNMTQIEQTYLRKFRSVLEFDSLIFSFASVTCCAIRSGNVECLTTLLVSKLPKRILEMPKIKRSDSLSVFVLSPIAYLFKKFVLSIDTLDSFLHILLKHKIISLDESYRVWIPNNEFKNKCITFHHPFAFMYDSSWPRDKQQLYLHLLNDNGVTTDYCLQCSYDTTRPLDTFMSYHRCYAPVLEAVCKNDEDMVQQFLSTSVILEPDKLGNCARTECQLPFRDINKFLISLKPAYYNPLQHSVSLIEFADVSSQEQFRHVTLQKLCRIVIRHKLRELTIDDNLCNFKKKIFELPLPIKLKDYLLFKS